MEPLKRNFLYISKELSELEKLIFCKIEISSLKLKNFSYISGGDL